MAFAVDLLISVLKCFDNLRNSTRDLLGEIWRCFDFIARQELRDFQLFMLLLFGTDEENEKENILIKTSRAASVAAIFCRFMILGMLLIFVLPFAGIVVGAFWFLMWIISYATAVRIEEMK